MTKVTNISTGPRGIYAATGLVMLEKGETLDLDLADGEQDAHEDSEWFEFDGGELDLHKLKVAELKAIAEAEGVDLGDATKKDDIISAIELAREG